MRSKDASGNVGMGVSRRVTVDVTGPLPVSNVRTVNVSWGSPFDTDQNDPTKNFKYVDIYRRAVGSVVWQEVSQNVNGLVGTFAHKRVGTGIYEYEVRSKDASGNVGMGVSRRVTVDVTGPLPVSNVRMVNEIRTVRYLVGSGTTSVNISWDNPESDANNPTTNFKGVGVYRLIGSSYAVSKNTAVRAKLST